jgi:hypothetical protein
MKRSLHVSIFAVALIVLACAADAVAQTPVFRLSAETQWAPPAEYITAAPPAAGAGGGVVTYSKSFFNLYPVVYISFDGAGAAHNGATLLLACTVNGVACTAAGGGGTPSAAIPTGWVGLYKENVSLSDVGLLPMNCKTQHIPGGSPEFVDCHTNSINYTWCAIVPPGPLKVELKLASVANPNTAILGLSQDVHYERGHVIIDGTKQVVGNTLCQPAAAPVEEAS